MASSRRQAISAAYLSHQGDKLTFVSRFRPRQQSLSLTLDVGDGDLRLEVQLERARESLNGDFICHGLITSGADQLSYPQVPESAERYAREFDRVHARLRALSPSLPSFRALSIDFSMGGLKLETEAKLTPGQQLQMSLDLDIPDQDPVPLDCRVVWCESVGKTYHAGLEFLKLEPWVPPLLQSFQAWLEGTGLRPRPYRPPPELEFPEPDAPSESEPVPPAGSISEVRFAQATVELVLAWTRGEVFRVVFQDVLVFRDNRGLEGAAFYDALDLEESRLITQALNVMPVSLEQERRVFHYQFLNRLDRPILEVVCATQADYQLD